MGARVGVSVWRDSERRVEGDLISIEGKAGSHGD